MSTYNHESAEVELSPTEVIESFKESWKQLLVCIIIGFLLGVSYFLIAPYKYQATAFIQVAKVAGIDVETPISVVQKLKMPMYYSKNTLIACNFIESNNISINFATRLNPNIVKNSPIISITFVEKSTEDATKCLESVFNDIRINQKILSEPILKEKNNQLANIKKKLDSAENISKILSTNKPNFNFSDSNISASLLFFAISINNENEMQNLRREINELEIELKEPLTKEASLVTPIYAPSASVEPKISLIILLSGILGGAFAIAYFVGRRVWLKIKIPPKSL
jgi:uncharacterized protein involved in exopolysaccharide biosynthesis